VANHRQRLVWSMILRMESGGRATSCSITRAAIRPPFGGLSHVLRYLSRYTHRVAISNRRLVSADVDDSKRRKTGCDVACPSGPWSSGQSWLRSPKSQCSAL
jgi:hypothetical protein